MFLVVAPNKDTYLTITPNCGGILFSLLLLVYTHECLCVWRTIRGRFDLVLEKEDKGLKDFSGSKSDALERRLQVLCLPNCTRGVVYDVQEVGGPNKTTRYCHET